MIFSNVARPVVSGLTRDVTAGLSGGPAPQPGYDIVLLLGQSNIVGYTTAEPDPVLDAPHASVKQWAMRGPDIGTVITATEHLMFPDTEVTPQPNTVSPGLAFGKLLVPSLGASREVLLVPAAWGATTLSNPGARWAPGRYNGSAYIGQGDLLRNALLALDGIMALPGTHRLKYVVWGQGEGDGTTPGVTEAGYRAALCDCFNAIKFHWQSLGETGIPLFVVNDMLPKTKTELSSQMQPILDAQAAVIARLPYLGWAEATVGAEWEDPAGGGHYSAAANRGPRAQAFYDCIAEAAANTAPDQATPATVTSLAATAASPAEIDLSWDDMANTTSYVVEYRATGQPAWSSVTTPTRIYRLTGLDPNTSYDVRVSGRNAAATGAPSATATASTMALVAAWARWSAHGGTSVTVDGSNNVTQIADATGNGRHATYPSPLSTAPDDNPQQLLAGANPQDYRFDAYSGDGRNIIEGPYPVGSSTLMLMFKSTAAPGETMVVCGGTASAANPDYWGDWGTGVYGFYLEIPENRYIYVACDPQSDFPTVGTRTDGSNGLLWSHDQWNCLAISFDDTTRTAKMYLNGALVDTTTGNYERQEQNRLRIGMSGNGNGHVPFEWAEAVMWNTTISDGQVAYETQQLRDKWQQPLI